jgi:hypothetical protein
MAVRKRAFEATHRSRHARSGTDDVDMDRREAESECHFTLSVFFRSFLGEFLPPPFGAIALVRPLLDSLHILVHVLL